MGSDHSGKDDWQEILNKALGGDPEALGILCQDYLKPKVYAFAMNMLKNPQDAEDPVHCWYRNSKFIVSTALQRIENSTDSTTN